MNFFSRDQTSFSLASSLDIKLQNEKFQNPLMSALNHGYCTFAAHHENSLVPGVFMSLLINYLITLSVKKEIIVLEKSLEKVLNFGSKICTNPAAP